MARKRIIAGEVYIAFDGSRYKIGCSTKVEQRLKTIQTGNSEKVSILYRRFFADMYRAEKSIHTIFAAQRKQGEWFLLSDKEKDLLEKIFTKNGLSEIQKRTLTRMGLLEE
jgi:T5orf172 domain